MPPEALKNQLTRYQDFRKAVIAELLAGEGDPMELRSELRRLDEAIGRVHIAIWSSERKGDR